ncbi:MAG: glutamate--tRNA ligase [Candidatus Taylorbacteria bacterium]|nr:glutamate--tRNA ligase [Candidatus Taylorbacteria bacterium]
MIRAIKALFKSKPKVVTRFAPSPTGYFHAGSYRTAVFSYIYAKQHEGKFILRIEDTDRARSKKEYEENIVESLQWLGIPYDEIHRQSDRTDIYREHLERLIAEDKAYVSKEEAKEGGEGERRTEVIRFRNPNKKVRFHDLIRGDIEFDTTELGDFVIAKSVTEPIFHFVVVLDDYLMGVTHVIRGEDHISNTPRQILIQEALNAPEPIYAHLPLVLAHDRSKLSKRHGAKPMTHYRDQGYIPSALLNYMCLLGWNPGTTEEIFDLAGLIKAFDLSKVQKGGGIFNEEKLRWVNKEHLKRLPRQEFAKKAREIVGSTDRAKDLKWDVSEEKIERLAPVLLDRIETYNDIKTMVESLDLDYFFGDPVYDAISLKWKTDSDLSGAEKHLGFIRTALKGLSDAKWNEASVKALVWPYAEAEGRGQVLWPFRFALSGKDKSPNPFTLAEILGKAETVKRLEAALTKCSLAAKPVETA